MPDEVAGLAELLDGIDFSPKDDDSTSDDKVDDTSDKTEIEDDTDSDDDTEDDDVDVDDEDSDDDSDEDSDDDDDDDDDDDVEEDALSLMRQEMAEMRAAIIASNRKQVEPEPLFEDPSFTVEDLITDEEYTAALESKGGLAILMQKVIDKVREDLIRDIPKVATAASNEQSTAAKLVTDFYTANEDLKAHATYVQYKANIIAAQFPNMSKAEILIATANEVRKDLKISAHAKKVDDKRKKTKKVKKVADAPTRTSTGRKKKNKSEKVSDLQHNIDLMLDTQN